VAGTGIRRPSCGAAADGTTTATVGKVDRGAVTVGSRWADAHIYDPLAVEPSRSTQHCAAGEREPALRTTPPIATELVISLNPVTRHVSLIVKKTGAANRAEAAGSAHRQGLVQRMTDTRLLPAGRRLRDPALNRLPRR
jgi:hypothetical protein